MPSSCVIVIAYIICENLTSIWVWDSESAWIWTRILGTKCGYTNQCATLHWLFTRGLKFLKLGNQRNWLFDLKCLNFNNFYHKLFLIAWMGIFLKVANPKGMDLFIYLLFFNTHNYLQRQRIKTHKNAQSGIRTTDPWSNKQRWRPLDHATPPACMGVLMRW